ncbi:helix-turn-helix domain-containing protein [Enterococcus faecium]
MRKPEKKALSSGFRSVLKSRYYWESQLKSQVYSVKEITEMTGISKATLYRYLKDNRE